MSDSVYNRAATTGHRSRTARVRREQRQAVRMHSHRILPASAVPLAQRAGRLRLIASRPAAWYMQALGWIILFVIPHADLPAQPRFEFRQELFTLAQRATRMVWQLEKDGVTQEIAQTHLPLALDFSVARRTHLHLGAAAGFSSAELPLRYALSGVADVQLRFSHWLAGDHWFLGAGVNLPSGKNKLDTGENRVVDLLTESLLGFPLQRPGVGRDVEFSLAHAANLSETLGLGIGATVVWPGAFEYRRESTSTYQPGPRYTATLMLNAIEAPVRWRLGTLVQFFGNDKLNGTAFFSQGWQLEQSAAVDWTWSRRWQLILALRQVWKADNDFLLVPAGEVPPEHFYIDNSTFAGLSWLRNWGRRAQAGIVLSGSRFGNSNQQLSRATVGRLGLQLSTKFSEHWRAGAGADYALGKAEEHTVRLRGYGLTAWLQARL